MSVSVLKFVFFLHGVALGRPGISEKDVGSIFMEFAIV